MSNPAIASLFQLEQKFGSIQGLFQLANSSGNGQINFDEARRFFPQYGLSAIELGQMWKVSCPSGSTLDRPKFQVAMQFIYHQVTTLEEIFRISPEDMKKYDRHFTNIAKGRTVIENNEARNFFVLSKLPMAILTQIWSISDTSRSGTMKKEDFIIAMHLINTKLKNTSFQIPISRPPTSFPKPVGGAVNPQVNHHHVNNVPKLGLIASPMIPTKPIDPMSNLNMGKVMTPTNKSKKMELIPENKEIMNEIPMKTVQENIVVPKAHNALPPLDQLEIIPQVAPKKPTLPTKTILPIQTGGLINTIPPQQRLPIPKDDEDDLPKPPLPGQNLISSGPIPNLGMPGPMPIIGGGPGIMVRPVLPPPQPMIPSVGAGGVKVAVKDSSLPHPRVHSLREEVADLHQQRIALSRQNLRLESDSQQIEAQIEALETERDELKETVKTQLESLEKLRKERVEHDKSRLALRNEMQELNGKRHQYLHEAQTLRQEILRLEPVLEQVKVSKKVFDDELKIYSVSVEKEMTRLKKLKEEIELSKEEYERGPDLVDRARAELEGTRREALERRKELLQIKEDVFIQRELVNVIGHEKEAFDKELKIAVGDLLEVKKLWKTGEEHLSQEKAILGSFVQKITDSSPEENGMTEKQKSSSMARIIIARQFCDEAEKMLESVSKLMLEEEIKMKRIRDEHLLEKRKEAEERERKRKLMIEEELRRKKQKEEDLKRKQLQFEQEQIQQQQQNTSTSRKRRAAKRNNNNAPQQKDDFFDGDDGWGDDDGSSDFPAPERSAKATKKKKKSTDEGWGDMDDEWGNVPTKPVPSRSGASKKVRKKANDFGFGDSPVSSVVSRRKKKKSSVPSSPIRKTAKRKMKQTSSSSGFGGDDDGFGSFDFPTSGRKSNNGKKKTSSSSSMRKKSSSSKKQTKKKSSGGGGFDDFGFDDFPSPSPSKKTVKKKKGSVATSSVSIRSKRKVKGGKKKVLKGSKKKSRGGGDGFDDFGDNSWADF